MNKNIYLILLILTSFACNEEQYVLEYYPSGNIKLKVQIDKDSIQNGTYQEFYENGELKSKTNYINGKISESLINFYENGKIKEKGLVKNNMISGWWNYYHENGNLNKKIEWFHLRDSTYKNQEIHFDSNGKIKIAPSAFFELQIPDTIQIGKNMARINNYISNTNDIDTRYLSVIIENNYPDLGKKKDTFPTLTDDSNSPFFGIYAEKVGKKIVEGKIEEKNLKTETINTDSVEIIISTKYRYFRKEIYVSDSGKKTKLSKELRAEYEKVTNNN